MSASASVEVVVVDGVDGVAGDAKKNIRRSTFEKYDFSHMFLVLEQDPDGTIR